MIRVVQYQAEHQSLWDEFVARAKNGVFLFQRGYMEYHRDRFQDHSLLFFADEKLVALMPANIARRHAGLAWRIDLWRDCLGRTNEDTTHAGSVRRVTRTLAGEPTFKKLIYKAAPHIYHEHAGGRGSLRALSSSSASSSRGALRPPSICRAALR